jgi:hypothetical protein
VSSGKTSHRLRLSGAADENYQEHPNHQKHPKQQQYPSLVSCGGTRQAQDVSPLRTLERAAPVPRRFVRACRISPGAFLSSVCPAFSGRRRAGTRGLHGACSLHAAHVPVVYTARMYPWSTRRACTRGLHGARTRACTRHATRRMSSCAHVHATRRRYTLHMAKAHAHGRRYWPHRPCARGTSRTGHGHAVQAAPVISPRGPAYSSVRVRACVCARACVRACVYVQPWRRRRRPGPCGPSG